MCVVQDLKGKKKILSQVKGVLGKIPGLKVLSIKLHGGYYRKKLVSGKRVWRNFFLIRIRLNYKIGNKVYKKSPAIYPSDVYPYGRQTLDVVEETAGSRYKERKSWYQMEDIVGEQYNFSLNRIKRMINRVSLVFIRLVTSQIIAPFPNVSAWICAEVKSFESLTFCYQSGVHSELFCGRSFFLDLFSP